MSIIDLLPGDAQLTSLQAGHVIFAQGDSGDFMYVVVEGDVQVLIEGKPVERVTRGGIVGEMALIDSGARSATAITKTKCLVVAVDERRFKELVSEYPEFALQVMRVLARRLRLMDSER
jgi:CRP-like cAMP-binding protein